MDTYGYIRLYVDIYFNIIHCMYICVFLAGMVLFVPSRHDCGTLPPSVGPFGSNTPSLLTMFFGTGLMEMFLWTVGAFYVFGETWDSTWF